MPSRQAAGAGVESRHALLRLQEVDDRVLDLAAGLEHGLLVLRHKLLEPRVLIANVVAEPAVVEDVPA